MTRDVNLDAARVAVRRSIISVAYEVQVSDAKTARSQRVIDLDPRTVEVLRAHRKKQAADAAASEPVTEVATSSSAAPTGRHCTRT